MSAACATTVLSAKLGAQPVIVARDTSYLVLDGDGQRANAISLDSGAATAVELRWGESPNAIIATKICSIAYCKTSNTLVLLSEDSGLTRTLALYSADSLEHRSSLAVKGSFKYLTVSPCGALIACSEQCDGAVVAPHESVVLFRCSLHGAFALTMLETVPGRCPVFLGKALITLASNSTLESRQPLAKTVHRHELLKTLNGGGKAFQLVGPKNAPLAARAALILCDDPQSFFRFVFIGDVDGTSIHSCPVDVSSLFSRNDRFLLECNESLCVVASAAKAVCWTVSGTQATLLGCVFSTQGTILGLTLRGRSIQVLEESPCPIVVRLWEPQEVRSSDQYLAGATPAGGTPATFTTASSELGRAPSPLPLRSEGNNYHSRYLTAFGESLEAIGGALDFDNGGTRSCCATATFRSSGTKSGNGSVPSRANEPHLSSPSRYLIALSKVLNSFASACSTTPVDALSGTNVCTPASSSSQLRATQAPTAPTPLGGAHPAAASTPLEVAHPTVAPSLPLEAAQPTATAPSTSHEAAQPTTAAASTPLEVAQPTAAPSLPLEAAQPTAASTPPEVAQPTAAPSTPLEAAQPTAASTSPEVAQPTAAPSLPLEAAQPTAASTPLDVAQPTTAAAPFTAVLPAAHPQPPQARAGAVTAHDLEQLRLTVKSVPSGLKSDIVPHFIACNKERYGSATVRKAVVEAATNPVTGFLNVEGTGLTIKLVFRKPTVQPCAHPAASAPRQPAPPPTPLEVAKPTAAAPSLPLEAAQPTTAAASTTLEAAQPTAASTPLDVAQPTAAISTPLEVAQPTTAAASTPLEAAQPTAASTPLDVAQPTAAISTPLEVAQPTAAASTPLEVAKPTAAAPFTAVLAAAHPQPPQARAGAVTAHDLEQLRLTVKSVPSGLKSEIIEHFIACNKERYGSASVRKAVVEAATNPVTGFLDVVGTGGFNKLVIRQAPTPKAALPPAASTTVRAAAHPQPPQASAGAVTAHDLEQLRLTVKSVPSGLKSEIVANFIACNKERYGSVSVRKAVIEAATNPVTGFLDVVGTCGFDKLVIRQAPTPKAALRPAASTPLQAAAHPQSPQAGAGAVTAHDLEQLRLTVKSVPSGLKSDIVPHFIACNKERYGSATVRKAVVEAATNPVTGFLNVEGTGLTIKLVFRKPTVQPCAHPAASTPRQPAPTPLEVAKPTAAASLPLEATHPPTAPTPLEAQPKTAAPSTSLGVAQPTAAASTPLDVAQPTAAAPSLPLEAAQPTTAASTPLEAAQPTTAAASTPLEAQPTTAASTPLEATHPATASTPLEAQPKTAAPSTSLGVAQPTAAASTPLDVAQPTAAAPSLPLEAAQPTTAASTPLEATHPATASTPLEAQPKTAAPSTSLGVAQPTAAISTPLEVAQPTAATSTPLEVAQPRAAAPSTTVRAAAHPQPPQAGAGAVTAHDLEQLRLTVKSVPSGLKSQIVHHFIACNKERYGSASVRKAVVEAATNPVTGFLDVVGTCGFDKLVFRQAPTPKAALRPAASTPVRAAAHPQPPQASAGAGAVTAHDLEQHRLTVKGVPSGKLEIGGGVRKVVVEAATGFLDVVGTGGDEKFVLCQKTDQWSPLELVQSTEVDADVQPDLSKDLSVSASTLDDCSHPTAASVVASHFKSFRPFRSAFADDVATLFKPPRPFRSAFANDVVASSLALPARDATYQEVEHNSHSDDVSHGHH